MARAVFLLLVVAAFVLPPVMLPATAQPKAANAQNVKKQAAPAKGRLPAHYAKIVDDAQRQRIYQIQATYGVRIDALQAELDALVAKRDADIRGVLSPEQLRQLDALVGAAQAARAAKSAKKAQAVEANAAGPNAAAIKRK
jgi:hypothetical protein